MNTLKLSIESWLLKWAEFCIEWFMNFFADPDYYWVEETYPGKSYNKKVTDKVNKNHIGLLAKKIAKNNKTKDVVKMTCNFIKNNSNTIKEPVNQLYTYLQKNIKQIYRMGYYKNHIQLLNAIKIE